MTLQKHCIAYLEIKKKDSEIIVAKPKKSYPLYKVRIRNVPYIPIGKRGFKSKFPVCEIINCILYKLKTGLQWNLLSVLQLFSNDVLHYKRVFGYYLNGVKPEYGKLAGVVLCKRINQKLIYLAEMQIAAIH
ncbi:transposase [Chryseobacterium sp. WG23]|nr:transposase [Chryseobacterium sp. WG23]MCQ9635660.1 transposase [Chryseobacterium sp. WG23]